jgi:glutathione S-transferase
MRLACGGSGIILHRSMDRSMKESNMAMLLISSKNYSSWSLRGFLLTRLARLEFEEKVVASDDLNTRAELLLRASSIRVPCLVHDGVTVWDTLAIAEYLNEVSPKAGLYPGDRMARARCRSISGEMHAGFSALRSSMPMNLRTEGRRIAVWSAAQADIDRITEIWRECLVTWKGPWLFGRSPTVADAMYAPVVTRFRSYAVEVDPVSTAYCAHIAGWPDLVEWVAAAQLEPEQIEELEVEF